MFLLGFIVAFVVGWFLAKVGGLIFTWHFLHGIFLHATAGFVVVRRVFEFAKAESIRKV